MFKCDFFNRAKRYIVLHIKDQEFFLSLTSYFCFFLLFVILFRSDVTVSVCALASGFSSEVHGLCTVTTCSTSNQVGNKSNNTRGQTSGRNNGKNNSIKGNSNDDNNNNNNNSNDDNNNDNDNNNNNESASAKGIQERGSKVSKNMNLRSATHKQVIHYKALDSGVKGCLSNNV